MEVFGLCEYWCDLLVRFFVVVVAGDRLVGQGSKNQSWRTPQNVATTLSYPTSGLGAQVSYVAIQANQVCVNYNLFVEMSVVCLSMNQSVSQSDISSYC